MTAGLASTAVTHGPVAPAITDVLPFRPRPLSRGERSSRVLHVFPSPRNHRVVHIADTLQAAFALELEFDFTVRRYIERPCRLQIDPRHAIDVSFWSQHEGGEARFHLVLPDRKAVRSTGGVRAVADHSMLADAAAREGYVLRITTEEQLRARISALQMAFELLPWVNWHTRLATRSVVRAHVLASLQSVSCVALSSLIQSIDAPHPHVRSVVAAMIHDGTLTPVDYVPGSSDMIMEVRRA